MEHGLQMWWAESGMLTDRSIEDFKKLDEQVPKWQGDYEVPGLQ